MNPLFTFLNALAAVHGSYLVCSGQWIVGTALIVVPLFSVYALALHGFPGIKQAGYFLNALLVIVGLAYTFYIMNSLAGSETEEAAGLLAFLREVWLTLWLLVLPAITGWLLWTQENAIKRESD